jgi:hypothetical protein
MRYQLHVNQQQAIELGITHINQALIFDLLTTTSTWADTIIIDNEVFYWVSRQTISNKQTDVAYISCIIEILILLLKWEKITISTSDIRNIKIRLFDLNDNWNQSIGIVVKMLIDGGLMKKIKQGFYSINREKIFIQSGK